MVSTGPYSHIRSPVVSASPHSLYESPMVSNSLFRLPVVSTSPHSLFRSSSPLVPTVSLSHQWSPLVRATVSVSHYWSPLVPTVSVSHHASPYSLYQSPMVSTSLHEGSNSLNHAEVNHAPGSYIYSMGICMGKFQHDGQNSWSTRVDDMCQQCLCEGF